MPAGTEGQTLRYNSSNELEATSRIINKDDQILIKHRVEQDIDNWAESIMLFKNSSTESFVVLKSSGETENLSNPRAELYITSEPTQATIQSNANNIYLLGSGNTNLPKIYIANYLFENNTEVGKYLRIKDKTGLVEFVSPTLDSGLPIRFDLMNYNNVEVKIAEIPITEDYLSGAMHFTIYGELFGNACTWQDVMYFSANNQSTETGSGNYVGVEVRTNDYALRLVETRIEKVIDNLHIFITAKFVDTDYYVVAPEKFYVDYTIDTMQPATVVVGETHTHTNKTLLDHITDQGDGDLFLADDGVYKEVPLKRGLVLQSTDLELAISPAELTYPTLQFSALANKKYKLEYLVCIRGLTPAYNTNMQFQIKVGDGTGAETCKGFLHFSNVYNFSSYIYENDTNQCFVDLMDVNYIPISYRGGYDLIVKIEGVLQMSTDNENVVLNLITKAEPTPPANFPNLLAGSWCKWEEF